MFLVDLGFADARSAAQIFSSHKYLTQKKNTFGRDLETEMMDQSEEYHTYITENLDQNKKVPMTFKHQPNKRVARLHNLM